MTEAQAEIDESNEQLIAAWRTNPRLYGQGDVVERRGVGLVAVFSHPTLSMLNATVMARRMDDLGALERCARAALRLGAERRWPWFFSLCREWLAPEVEAAADELLADLGLALEMHVTGMATDALVPPDASPVEMQAWEMRIIRTAAEAEAAGAINLVSYGLPAAWSADSVGRALVYGGDRVGCLAIAGADRTPVSTATAIPLDGRLYVALVATLPSWRRRGAAEQAMRFALAEAERRTGLRRTTLHATEIGRPLYQRMGYRSVARFSWYVPRAR